VSVALAVDTCILLEATDAARLNHSAAVYVLELHPDLVLSAQVIREYLAASTRPTTANGLGLALSAARANVSAFRANVRLLPEERPVLPAFFRLLDEAPCTGRRLYDAHLAATAIAHEVRELLTLNGADFAPFAAHLSILTPVEALARLGAAPP
jgi:predicted nucleic acid-binding protein